MLERSNKRVKFKTIVVLFITRNSPLCLYLIPDVLFDMQLIVDKLQKNSPIIYDYTKLLGDGSIYFKL